MAKVTPYQKNVEYVEGVGLYRLYDAAGVLLYVGISNNPEARFRSHSQTAFWWGTVDHHELEWYRTREEALAEESWAIFEERPMFNKDRPLDQERERVQRRR